MEVPKYYYYDDFLPFYSLFQKAGARPVCVPPGGYLLAPGQGEENCYYIEEGVCVLQGSRSGERDTSATMTATL